MKNREHALYEQYLIDQKMDQELQKQKTDLMKKQSQEKFDFFAKLDRYRSQNELKKLKRVGLEEAVYNDMLATAFKAIYVSALQESGGLSERARIIAENNVDSYIKENGGAKRIVRENAGRTCLLDTIFEFVNEATQDEINNFDILEEAERRAKKNVDAAEAANPVKDDEQNRTLQQAEELQQLQQQQQAADDQAEPETPADQTEDQETQEQPVPVDDNGNPIPTDDNQSGDQVPNELNPEDIPAADQTAEDPNALQQQEEIPQQDDVDINQPLPELKDSKEDLFNKMEKEDDINAAVDLIAQRVQDAEQEFIKKNAQDKKKIEKIVDKLSNRLDGATDQGTKDNALDVSQAQQDQEVAQAQQAQMDQQNQAMAQAQQEAARAIRDTRNRYYSVFEEMVKDNTNYIMKNNVLRESYIDNGHIDMTGVVESSRVMYGFLEFVNTMKLESVNEDFIKNVLEDK